MDTPQITKTVLTAEHIPGIKTLAVLTKETNTVSRQAIQDKLEKGVPGVDGAYFLYVDPESRIIQQTIDLADDRALALMKNRTYARKCKRLMKVIYVEPGHNISEPRKSGRKRYYKETLPARVQPYADRALKVGYVIKQTSQNYEIWRGNVRVFKDRTQKILFEEIERLVAKELT